MAEQISVSDIRAKFPMYGDMSDDQLVMAVRQKFYSDIPPQQFYNRVKFTAQDPTEGMSGFDKAVAGYGKAGADIVRGAGQWLGLVNRDEVAESRKLDAPLMNTGAGRGGNIAGSLAALLPTAFIPGVNTMAGAAAIGAGTGALQPSVSTGETLKDIGIGGVLGPAALGVGRAVGAGWNAMSGLLQPFTGAGQKRLAADTVSRFATDPVAAEKALRSAAEIVPSSMPTMAQASGDAGLAQLERTLMNNPETMGALSGQIGAQRAARLKAVQDVAGTAEHYAGIKDGRRIFANEDYSAAMTQGIDKDMAAALQPQIASLMERPSIQKAQREAISLAKESGRTIDDFGSIEGLDWLKKGLDNLVDKARAPGSSIGGEKLRAMQQTRSDLMSVLEDVAPAYKLANENYAKMSKQVNSMDVARDLLEKMQSPLARAGASGRELRNEYARALEQATDSVKKQTGQNKSIADVMTTSDLEALQNVAKDMGRAAKAEEAGLAIRSNTAQNFASQNLLRRTLGPTGLPESWSESVILQQLLSPLSMLTKATGSDRAVKDLISQAASDPAMAASLLSMARQQSGLLSDSFGKAQSFLPGSSLGLLPYFSQK